jgi:hypothetical protein
MSDFRYVDLRIYPYELDLIQELKPKLSQIHSLFSHNSEGKGLVKIALRHGVLHFYINTIYDFELDHATKMTEILGNYKLKIIDSQDVEGHHETKIVARIEKDE